jgi:hypothetical protein
LCLEVVNQHPRYLHTLPFAAVNAGDDQCPAVSSAAKEESLNGPRHVPACDPWAKPTRSFTEAALADPLRDPQIVGAASEDAREFSVDIGIGLGTLDVSLA